MLPLKKVDQKFIKINGTFPNLFPKNSYRCLKFIKLLYMTI